jgi:hypothetical protein
MRPLVVLCVIGLSVAWTFSSEVHSANGAQFLQQGTQPGTENGPEQRMARNRRHRSLRRAQSRRGQTDSGVEIVRASAPGSRRRLARG